MVARQIQSVQAQIENEYEAQFKEMVHKFSQVRRTYDNDLFAPEQDTPAEFGGLPRLTTKTYFPCWKNKVLCLFSLEESCFKEQAVKIIWAMDDDIQFKAQHIIKDIHNTYKDIYPRSDIKTLEELMTRLDDVLNATNETNEARMMLKTIKQSEHETLLTYYTTCLDLWERATLEIDNPTENLLIQSFLNGLRNRMVAWYTSMQYKKTTPPMTAKQVYNFTRYLYRCIHFCIDQGICR